ncbi:hypothetical protein M3Y94_00115600 [Aphelenchoides besseyi]|nr:hypothetical protein M3Y94_00115600 [Aphelenchoides besseyi]
MLGLVNFLLAAVLAPQKTAVDIKSTAKTIVERGLGVCQLPLAVGNCSRVLPRYYYHEESQLCYKFTYTGCFGNGNRFVTRDQCQQRCDRNWIAGRTKVSASFKGSQKNNPINIFVTADSTVFTDADCEECKKNGGSCVKNEYVNECLWENCPLNSICKNTVGSFRCECKVGHAGNVCEEPFDTRYESKCDNSGHNSWEIRFFYNPRRSTCQRFWYGGCVYRESNNFFVDAQTCEAICDTHDRIQSSVSSITTTTPADTMQEMYGTTTFVTDLSMPELCLDRFDERRRHSCTRAEWTQRWYYDHQTRSCRIFWFDKSCAHQHFKSRNVFVHESTCKRACEGVNPDLNTRLQFQSSNHSRGPTAHSTSTQKSPHQLATPVPTLATRPPIVRPVPTSRKTVGVIQAMFTQTIVTQTESISEQELLSEPTGRPLDANDFNGNDVQLTSTQRNRNNTNNNRYSPLDISADCLQPFDSSLRRSCSSGSQPWRQRFYYNTTTKTCEMYWSDGCKSQKSRNDYDDLRTCQWLCEGRTLRAEASHCLDEFDKTYLDNCNNGRFELRYFFNHERKDCELFYYGGCKSKSKNIFDSYNTCQELCSTASRYTTKACLQPFDPVYRDSCDRRTGTYALYYYYDQSTQACRSFWYGNCKGKSENLFADLKTCQWLCETKPEQKVPNNCLDRFDENYRKPCNRGAWTKRWYFEHESGQCKSFFYDGCVGQSQNIFMEEEDCKNLCELPALPTEGTIEAISEASAEEKEAHRCFEPLSIGNCSHRLPAYYYNLAERRCEPMMFSGCKGNGNRFLTIGQCNSTCNRFRRVKPDQLACYLPLSAGFGRQNVSCIKSAGYRFYYNKRCGKFYFLGCGGNENRWYDYSSCQSTCGNSNVDLLDEPKPLSACFLEIDKGVCADSNSSLTVTRFAYDANARKCYEGCDGNLNRFEDENACVQHCGPLKTPNSIGQCTHPPDWGQCNFLRQQWFYNLSSGVCEQFLYGGCGGNPNRFTSFELCQVTCEVPSAATTPATDICADKLDRGSWCEAMSNRYYFHQKSKSCKGFHYTGCGKSRNNFQFLEDCEDVCIHRRRPTSLITEASKIANTSDDEVKYTGVKPSERSDPQQHVILVENNQRYLKSDGQWLSHLQCLGFRYNISGQYTRLKSYICLMESIGNNPCQVQTLTSTNGEEKCQFVRPWLTGNHFYTHFFTVERRPWRWSPTTRRRQSASQTIAAIMILPTNDCHSIC